MTRAADASDTLDRIVAHLACTHPDADGLELAHRLLEAIGAPDDDTVGRQRWDEADAVLITYGDSIVAPGRVPLQVLAGFVRDHLRRAFSTVHVLPFFPYSSDRGFSVIDHRRVDPELGSWGDIDALADEVDLMVDLVCNHASASSAWFAQLVADEEPGRSMFMTVPADTDTTAVVRPRTTPLLYPVETAGGVRHLWCTFGPDQIDLDVANPDVLVELTRTIGVLVDHGARFIRLDAVAYMGKQVGTSCIHLPQTHEIVRLWHTLLEHRRQHLAIVTETNVPDAENRSYFGAGDEAHVIYNFSLPPLVIDAVLRGSAASLVAWLRDLPAPPAGCTLLNFLSSHDGIGVRPAEGILDTARIDELVEVCERRGGLHGTYATPDGHRPYELNIALWDLLAPTPGTPASGASGDAFVCAHVLMIGLAGVPAIYVNSLLAAGNDRDAAEASGVRRDISRRRIPLDEALGVVAGTSADDRAAATTALLRALEVRRRQPAFHPDAAQRILDVDDRVVAVERVSIDRTQRIVALHNVSAGPVEIDLDRLFTDADTAVDLLDPGLAIDPAGPLVVGAHRCQWLTATPR